MQRAKRRPGRPPGRTREKTRAKVLRAARICFASKGFDLATNRDIAARAGVTPAAIYSYFDSKTALYGAAMNEAIAEATAQMQADAVRKGTAAAVFSRMVRSLTVLHERDPSLAAFLSVVPTELRRHPELAAFFDPERTDLHGLLAGIVARATETGELAAEDARGAAEMFVACLMGLSQHASFIGGGRAPASAFAELLEGRLFKRRLVRAAPKGARRASGTEKKAAGAATRPRRGSASR